MGARVATRAPQDAHFPGVWNDTRLSRQEIFHMAGDGSLANEWSYERNGRDAFTEVVPVRRTGQTSAQGAR